MNVIQELTALRAALQSLAEKTDQLIAYCSTSHGEGSALDTHAGEEVPVFESIYPLCAESGFFKGKSVVAVIFPDGVRVETPTWKKMVEVIVKRCNEDAEKHAALMGLRNRIQGRSRQLLGNSAAEMRSPIQIDRELYMESHYDTESLLRVMKSRILDAVGYDYSGIQVAIRNI